MGTRTRWIKRRALALAVAAVGVVAIAGTAVAGHQTSGVKSYTGCLVPNDGVIVKIKEGNAPKSACTGGQVEAHFSGGDITKISVGNGLTLPNGSDNGEVRIELAAGQTLPSGCAAGRVVEWSGSAWICGVDNDTTYTADGTTLDLTGTQFSVDPDYRVKNTDDCPSGQFATGFDSNGVMECGVPPTPTGLQAFAATADLVQFGGTATIITKAIPAGKYVLSASVTLVNRDQDSASTAYCWIPGYSPSSSPVVLSGFTLDELARMSLSLNSAIDHPGGPVKLECHEVSADVDVREASLTAIKVDSIG